MHPCLFHHIWVYSPQWRCKMWHWWCSQGFSSGSDLPWNVVDGAGQSVVGQQPYLDLVVWWSGYSEVYAAAVVVGWIHVSTWRWWWVEILQLSCGEGVAEYFFLPVVVLEGYQCHFAGPGVVVSDPASAYPGSLISSFSAYGATLANSLVDFAQRCWLPKVLAVSEVSPFEVKEALGLNAQQCETCFWLLQCLQKTLHSLQYDWLWLFLEYCS